MLPSETTSLKELTGATDAGNKAFSSPRNYGLYYGSLELDAEAKVAGFTCEEFLVTKD